jgi:hypothetical protein
VCYLTPKALVLEQKMIQYLHMFDFEIKKARTMLKDQIRESNLSDFNKLVDAGMFAERLLTSDALRQEFEGGAIRRKLFCEALDIGESTLSTWLQTGRIPRVAAVAYTLWLVVRKLAQEIQRRDELANELYVIRNRDGYAVVQPPVTATAGAVGNVIAAGIETLEIAREIAAAHSPSSRRMLDQAIKEFRNLSEQFDDDDEYDTGYAQFAINLERVRDYKIGPTLLEEVL